jgi:hypothetical protein
MAITQTELWTALGVLVAAAAASAGGGYYHGKDSAQAKIDSLSQNIDELKRLSKIDIPLLLETLEHKSTALGEKIRLDQQVKALNAKIVSLESELSRSKEEAKSKDEMISAMKSDISRLQSLTQKDFSQISEIRVSRNNAYWIVPGQVAINVSSFSTSSVHTTITGTTTGEWIDLGERIDVKYGDNKCFLILMGIKNPEATFSFACLAKSG